MDGQYLDRKLDHHSEQKEEFKRYLRTSLMLHVGVAILCALSYIAFPSRSDLFTPTVQIDMVALPDILKNANQPILDKTLPVKDAPPPPPSHEKEKAVDRERAPDLPREKEDDRMALQKEKAAESEAKKALERLRNQVKKSAKADEEKKRQEMLDKREADLKRFEEAYRNAIKGNQTNEGSSTTGDLKATMNAYAGHVREKLRANWALPAYLQSNGLSASVRIYIDAYGNVAGMRFSSASGNSIFDDYVKQAVQRSSPFAPPPSEMSRGLRNSGMEVAFPL